MPINAKINVLRPLPVFLLLISTVLLVIWCLLGLDNYKEDSLMSFAEDSFAKPASSE